MRNKLPTARPEPEAAGARRKRNHGRVLEELPAERRQRGCTWQILRTTHLRRFSFAQTVSLSRFRVFILSHQTG